MKEGWSPGLALLAAAVGIVGGAGAWWWTSSPPPAPQAASAPAVVVHAVAGVTKPVVAVPVVVSSAAPASRPPARAAAPQRVPRTRDPDGDQTPDLSDYVNPGEQPTMAEVITRLHQAGIYTGLGAFSPPGTRPPLVGLAVPEDFVLPDGYVRHYQATDDGQRIEPILMFAPGREFVDAAGNPVAIPADRVVPSEMAPPGLALRQITVPAPVDPGRPRN